MCRLQGSAFKWSDLGAKSQKAFLAAGDDRKWTYGAREGENAGGMKNIWKAKSYHKK